MALSNIIDMKIINPCDGLILRFKNDFGGRDLVHFPGNYLVSFEQGETRTVKSNISDFSDESKQRGTSEVISIEAGEKILCSRWVKKQNGPGMKQLFTSRYVEIYTGKKVESIPGGEIELEPKDLQFGWLQVQIAKRDWNERIKENQIFISAEIELPEILTDEL